MQPTAFVHHLHTCLILKKMTQLIRFKAIQNSVASSPYRWKHGCSPLPAGLQSTAKAKTRCYPRPRSLHPHCPPQSLQHGWRPPASFSSSGGAGGIWIVCELEEDANKAFNSVEFGEGNTQPDPHPPPFPSSRTIHSRRKVNSQALPSPFLRTLLGQTIGAQKGGQHFQAVS